MGIFDRIRKIFSRRSDPSRTSTDRFPHGARVHGHSNEVTTEFNHVVQRSYQVEHNRHFNIPASSQRSSNVIDRPSAIALRRSNTTSVAARASNTSHTQPDANLERANSCKGFTLPLLEIAEGNLKVNNKATNVSQLRHSTGSHEIHGKDDSKVSNENDCRQKYPRPSDSKTISAAYSTTSESKRKTPYLNSLQSTLKPAEYRKQTENQNTFPSMGNVDNINPLEFELNRQRKISSSVSSSISTVTRNRECRSTVEVDQRRTSKYSIPTTSVAQTSYNTLGISQQGSTNNTAQQTLSNTKTVFACSVTPHKTDSRKISDHNRGIGGFGNPQQSTSINKTGTSSITKTSAFVPSIITPHKIERPIKLSDHSRGTRQVFSNSQQSATLNKTNTAQTSSNSKAPVNFPSITSYKRDSTTIPDYKRSPMVDEPVPMDYEPTIPQRTRTYLGVDKFAEPSEPSHPEPPDILISRFARFDFHPVKDSSTESILQRLNPSSKIAKPLQASVVPITVKEAESKDFKNVKPQYFLRNFTYNLQTLPKDKNFKSKNDSMYHNQWTECSAQILNEFNNPVDSQKKVDVSTNSRHVDFRDIKIKNGRLHFRMKCNVTGNISILITISSFTLTKDVYVTFNPCSSSLSDMTIEKFIPAENEFVFRVFIYDVFGEPVPSNSTANYKLYASFLSTENTVVSQVKQIEQEQICYDITVRGNRPWSRDLVVLLDGKQVSHAREFEFTEEECEAIDDLEDEDYEWIQQFFDEGDCGIFIPLTTGEDDGEFVAYDENDCELQSQNVRNHQLLCKYVRKYDILGPDYAHINNIKRVLELKDRIDVHDTEDGAVIDLKNIKSRLYPICKEVVQHLLRGLYYRRKASEVARVRMEWKNRLIGIDEVLWLESKTPSFAFCKYFKDFFGDLLNKYNREACDELFKFFNFRRDESEVDLHGLLVADEKKLESLRLNLLIGSLSQDQIEEILEICEIKSKEGRERQTFRKKFRSGKVPENLVKEFMDEKLFDEVEHECSDEDCSLCFENDSNNYGSEYDDDYDDKDGSEYDDDDDDSEYHDDDDGSEYHDDDGDLEWLRSSGRSKCFQNKSSGRNDRGGNVDAIIRRCRLESDEAIRKLKEKLGKFNLRKAMKNNTPWLEIIVGAGRHSRKNEQNIRPKVEKLLKQRNLKFSPVNKGSLVVTFKRYSKPGACFGEYYCEKCDNRWKSSKSYVGKYQKCKSCEDHCWPVKQREKEKVVNYHRDGAGVKRQSNPHRSSLCQECQELGHPCNKDDYYDSDY